MQKTELRSQIDEQLGVGAWTRATASLAQLWNQQPGAATAGFVTSRFQQIRQHAALIPLRVSILRSFTVEPLLPVLTASGFVHGLDLSTQTGDFNSYTQELLDESSRLYQFSPDVAILAVRLCDIAPDLANGYAELQPRDAEASVERVIAGFRSWIRAFRSHSNASLIVHNMEQPLAPSQGILDAQTEGGQQSAVQRINAELKRIAAEYRNTYVLDYDGLIARQGRARWYDERKWLMARMPFAAESMIHIVNEWLRFLHPLAGKICKVLVTDLDNTLWAGVLGEDGMEGIKVGAEYPGGAYLNLQRAMLDLYQRGVVLAISSKNDEADALRAIDTHSGMLLRSGHFSSIRINWTDKAQSLREIAAELNVGIDALAFLDDNPAERDRVRMDLPEVTVIELPSDPFEYAAVLRNTPVFERLTLSKEDRDRNTYYAGQRERAELANNLESVEDFYRSLDQEVEIALADQPTFARVAQLTQKTNQFNLTTRRYTEEQIANLANAPGSHVYAVRVKDRFGDNGLVGVAITRQECRRCQIDTLLLSCRVIGRTVETALLSYLAACARSEGAEVLQGEFLPTKKNAPAANFYRQHQFEPVSTSTDGRTEWSLDLSQTELSCPQWIRLIVPENLYREHACS
jgi:FkbH-like protein